MDDFMNEFEALKTYTDAQLDMEMEQTGEIRAAILADIAAEQRRMDNLTILLMILTFSAAGFLTVLILDLLHLL